MDRQRLADALAYDQARRRRLASVVPMPASGQPETASTPSLRSNVENLSIGLGEGLTNQLEGVRALVTDPIGTAKGTYEAVRGVVRDPSVIAQALREMGSRAASGPLGAGEVVGEMFGPMRGRPAPDMLELDVYHGTPHRFPATEANPLGEFDASKIGTGEGAQAYGKGIYFTESPDVAKGYQPRDPKAEAKLMNLYKQAEARQNYDAMEVLEAAMLHRTADELREQFPRQKGLVGRIAKIQEQSPSSLYKADLPDEMIDRMLDYDKPINEHSQVVLDALERAGINTQSAMRAGQMIEGQEAHLAKFGIPGIIYREGRGKGPRNFVVFPGEEKKVRILERK